MKKYFRLLVEGKRDDDWHEGYFANLKKTITPYGGIFNGKHLVHGETGKIVTTGPTDSQHYGIVLSNLGQFGFQSPQHMADTVNAHNANNPNYKPLTGTSILSETEGFGPVFDYLKDHGWAHVTQQASNIRPTTYIRTANHAAAQSAMSVIKDQLLPEVSIETKTHVSELRSRQEIEHYMTSPDPSALIYSSRKPTIETRQPTQAERYATDAIIRKSTPKWKMEAESFTFSKLRTQLNEEHKDRARVLTSYRKQMLDAGQTAKDNSPIKESWKEYDAKVGETNTSLFEPGNTKFNMKAFLKKLRKKYGVKENLPGEN